MARRLRIAVLEASGYAPVGGTAPTAASHRELDALIRRFLPAATATLLAEPRPSADGREVGWYSDLAGQPVKLRSLPPAEQAAARERLTTRLTALDGLVARLRTENPAQAERLEAALRYPGDDNVYVVGDEPVLTFWGHQVAGRAPLGPPVAAPPAAPVVVDAPAATTLAPAASARGRGGRRVALALLALLALGLAGYGMWNALGWGLWWPPWGPDYAKLVAAAEAEQTKLADELASLERALGERVVGCAADASLAAARTEGARLEGAAAVLEERMAAALEICGPRGELAKAEADGRALADALASAEKQLDAKLDDCRVAAAEKQKAADEKKAEVAKREAEAKRVAQAKQKEDAVAKPKTPEKPPDKPAEKTPEKPQPKPTETAKAEPTKRPDGRPPCPGERTKEEAPDVAMVLDASGSMAFAANAVSAEIERQMQNIPGPVGILGSILMGQAGGGPSRLEQAKKGVNSVVRSLPNDVDVGMMVLRRCPSAESLGFFSPAERPRLLASVQALQPTQGTPLAQGLRGAGQMVDGVDAEGVIVVISDGEDSCGGDPCAEARALKRMKPKLTINVVDIIGNGAGSCMAAATGGRVISPDSGLEFEKAIRAAAEQAMKPSYCP